MFMEVEHMEEFQLVKNINNNAITNSKYNSLKNFN